MSSDDLYGPALPPGFVVKKTEESKPKSHFIGPVLPTNFQPTVESSSDAETDDDDDDDDDEEEEEEEEEEFIGPLPGPSQNDGNLEKVKEEFESRSKRMKMKLSGENDEAVELKRESWMTELPDCLKKNIGLGARSFSKRPASTDTDRSVWTDTPSDRIRKLGQEDTKVKPAESSLKDTILDNAEKDIAASVENYNKSKRSESLLDIHQRNLKRKLKEDGNQPKERVPFDREKDLQTNYFDEAQRKAIIKRSAQLNDRFSAGNRKFL